jgi:hypothetical protein
MPASILRSLTIAAALLAGFAHAEPPPPNPSADLRATYEQYRGSLARNDFGKPLQVLSTEDSRSNKGEVYAVVEIPFATVATGFAKAAQWCDVLILPFNTKHCRAAVEGGDTLLQVRVGRKSSQPPEEAYRLDFRYQAQARAADYFRSTLEAPKGPVGTHDYRVALEAIPLDAQRTFIHLSYSYGFGTMSRLAMLAYLGTTGSGKVGFTVTGRDGDGKPIYIGGMRGATERNAMRYFLAIEAYLASLSAPERERVARRLADWFAATERYPRQLHEMDRGEYLAMKEQETKRVGSVL